MFIMQKFLSLQIGVDASVEEVIDETHGFLGHETADLVHIDEVTGNAGFLKASALGINDGVGGIFSGDQFH